MIGLRNGPRKSTGWCPDESLVLGSGLSCLSYDEVNCVCLCVHVFTCVCVSQHRKDLGSLTLWVKDGQVTTVQVKRTCFIWFCEAADTDMRLTLRPHMPLTEL